MAGRGRDDAAIAEALGMLAGVLGGNPNVVGMGAARQLSEFQKNNPPMFKGAYDPDGAQKWLKEIERIFRVTECADNQKVSPQCPKPKKENQSGGKVFALSGSETSADDRLIRGTRA
ncbi:hypothetical protein KIW84_024354 [Lathyrus oleraceus]|uniref:Cellular nucleic acid-binding protein n=1 Tax=Pisum sativum TaxID=3888 RepID=A0A9D4YGN1_PEA|nr:hypothetical protein KIW84_024354 [Pisum sativum]